MGDVLFGSLMESIMSAGNGIRLFFFIAAVEFFSKLMFVVLLEF
jgi:hypothetical protein